MDLRFSPFTFADTVVSVAPVSEAGTAWFSRHFGEFACEATVSHTGFQRLLDAVQAEGLAIREAAR